ncbi:hypothetical protein PAEPH01_0371 [Pancytospora epiphaga]|nr:hypothetical protein PAEPH01_0371 [Pancytospora epiphaga]
MEFLLNFQPCFEMEGLFNLSEDKVNDYLNVVRRVSQDDAIEAIRVAIDQMPSIAKVVSILIDKMINEDQGYRKLILNILLSDTEDDISIVSRAVYLTYLGASSVLDGVDLSSHIQPVSRCFEDCQKTISLPALFSKSGSSDDFINTFYCYSIIRNIDFYKAECRYRLLSYNNSSIIEAILVDESLSGIGMAIEMCRSPGFLEYLSKHIHRFKERVKITSLIFISFYRIKPAIDTGAYICMANDRDKEALKEMFDKDTECFCLKVGNKTRLNMFLGTDYSEVVLPVMSRENFINGSFPSQKEFFEAFFAVSSPSVSHFFNYLEEFKNRFILNETEQQLFLTELRKFHENNTSYLEIVLPRLVKFNIINESLI